MLSCLAWLWLTSLGFGGENPEWGTLFDGKTLAGWKAEGGAEWGVQQGAIVGRQGSAGAGGDLFTEQAWADFELEAEFKVRWPANSGVWFRRSSSQPGYQADILDEPTYPNTFSGSLYAMGKGFLERNSDAKTVKKNGWNRLRLSAMEEEIVIALNGKTVVRSRDRRFLEAGSIGLQVHAGNQYQGMEIRVRNIRLRPVVRQASNQSCLVCHANFAAEKIASVHLQAGIECRHCHGASLAHSQDEDNLTPPEVIFNAARGAEFCKGCHPTHRAPLASVVNAHRTCGGCHGNHTIERGRLRRSAVP